MYYVLGCICVGYGHVNLQLQAVVNYFTRVLGNKPGSLQEKCALNHWAISQDPWRTFSLSVKGLHRDQGMHRVSLLSTCATMGTVYIHTLHDCFMPLPPPSLLCRSHMPLHPASCLWKSALGLEDRGSPLPLILGDKSPWASAKSVN